MDNEYSMDAITERAKPMIAAAQYGLAVELEVMQWKSQAVAKRLAEPVLVYEAPQLPQVPMHDPIRNDMLRGVVEGMGVPWAYYVTEAQKSEHA